MKTSDGVQALGAFLIRRRGMLNRRLQMPPSVIRERSEGSRVTQPRYEEEIAQLASESQVAPKSPEQGEDEGEGG